MEDFVSSLFVIAFFFLFFVSSWPIQKRIHLLKEKFPEEIARTRINISGGVEGAVGVWLYRFFYILFQRYKKLKCEEINTSFRPVLIIINIQFLCFVAFIVSRCI